MPKKERLYTPAEVERLICWIAKVADYDRDFETIELLATCHDYEYFLDWREQLTQKITKEDRAKRRAILAKK